MDYDLELPTGQATIMDFAQSVSLPSSGSSTPQVSHCYFLQLCNADIRKYAIMHTAAVISHGLGVSSLHHPRNLCLRE
ncbi:hypothetical protein TNCV_3067261 [Trichonephila clavipes]|nr:hypothetical protein TNCV_3067261 [Trichonephila clavipes]